MHNRFIHILFGFVLFGLLLLGGCSTVSRKDGPPPYPVDETKIPNAVPKKEALSKYGNYKTYHVFGKSYHTLSSSKNYQAEGVASWYGSKFHSVRTSSGEPYNMLAMTAAHKTLPLPTYVRVTNLANKKEVIVKVNDRGPFEGNRLIDLSYVAAKKLGMLGHGTAHVRVTAIDPDNFNKTPTFSHIPMYAKNNHTHSLSNPMYANNAFYLQVGAFKNRMYAERLKNRISKLTSTPIHITQRTPHTRLFHVQIGPIKDIATMGILSKRLKSVGLHTHKVTEV